MNARTRPIALLATLALAACSSSTEPASGGETGGGATTSTTSTATGTTTSTATSTETLGSLTVAELHAELATKDFLLVNVHVPHDGDIPGTDQFLAYTDLEAIAAFVGPDKAKKVVVYCMGTSMSKPVGTDLAARGYAAVRYLEGGYSAWTKAGYDLTQ